MEKLVCKRTCMGEKSPKWSKNKQYKFTIPSNVEKEFFKYYIETHTIESSGDTYYAPVKKSEYEKYFYTIEEHRDNRINEILNDDKYNNR